MPVAVIVLFAVYSLMGFIIFKEAKKIFDAETEAALLMIK